MITMRMKILILLHKILCSSICLLYEKKIYTQTVCVRGYIILYCSFDGGVKHAAVPLTNNEKKLNYYILLYDKIMDI